MKMKLRTDGHDVRPAKAERKGIGFFLPAGVHTNPLGNAGMKVVAGAIVLAIALAVVAFSSPATPKQTGAQGTSQVTALVTTPSGSATFTQGPGEAVVSSACTGSTETYGNMTLTLGPCVTYGFPSATVKNATLDTRPVLALIRTAYEYHIVYFAFSRSDSNVMYAVLNVTGRQVVAGNWTTGYQVSYVGNELVNVTVMQVMRSTYRVTHVSSYGLPERNTSLSYAPQQVQDIRLALSDSQVKSLMSYPPYYVQFVGAFGNGKVDTNASYLVQLYQVDGTGVVGASVNPDLGLVTSAYTQLRISGECWPDGIVITDPWGEAGSIACKA